MIKLQTVLDLLPAAKTFISLTMCISLLTNDSDYFKAEPARHYFYVKLALEAAQGEELDDTESRRKIHKNEIFTPGWME